MKLTKRLLPQGALASKIPLILLTASIPIIATAQDETPTELAPVEVWATEVSASSVKVKNETIAIKQADHISDLLRTIPGVDVGGAHSLNQRITIRSMDDKDLRISIDGANQNTYMYHHMGNLQIHADILEEVDVNIGTNSVLDGGLGGSVRFVTKSADQLLREGERIGGRLQATISDNSGESLALTGYGKISDNTDFLAYHNIVNKDDFEVGGGEIRDFNGNVVAGTDGTVRGFKGDLSDTLLKFGWDIDDEQRLSVGYEYYIDEGNYTYRPDMGIATDLAIFNNLGGSLLWPTEFSRDTITVNYDRRWGDRHTLNANVFHNDSTLTRDERAWASVFPASAGIIEGEAINSGVNALVESTFGDHTITYGGEVIDYDTEYVARYDAGNTAQSDEEARNSALYIQDQYWISDQFAVIPGIRYNHFDIKSRVVDNTFSKTTGALAAEYYPTDTLMLRASTTQLFKGPEIGEVFIGAGRRDTPNPDIEAETGLNTELSIAYENALLGADLFATGITVFRTEIDNYIYDYAPPPPGVTGRFWKDNVGDMTIEGFEAYVAYDTGPLHTLLTLSVADSELDAFPQYSRFNDSRLDRTQGDTLSINVDYDLATLDMALHWDVLYVDDVDRAPDLDGATANNRKDGFTVHNVSLRWQPRSAPEFTLTVGIDNLFDEYYASQSSRTGLSSHPRFGDLYLQDYEPGRNFKLTAAYDF